MVIVQVGTIVMANGGVGVVGGSLVGQIEEHLTVDQAQEKLVQLGYEIDHTVIVPVPGWKIDVYNCTKISLDQ